MRVLIVDDTMFIRVTLKRMLEANRITVIGEAENGLEAVKKYKILSPDFVIMDISMPVMDGIEAVKQIKQFDPQANIIICSLQGQRDNVMEAIKAGARSFLVKPIQNIKLLKEIEKIAVLVKKNNEEKASRKFSPEDIDKLMRDGQEELNDLTESGNDVNHSEQYLMGIEAGYLEARREIATNLIRLGIGNEIIMNCVEITAEEIEQYKTDYGLK